MFTLAQAATPPVPGLGHAPPLPGQRGQLVPRGQGRHGGHDLAAAAWAAGPGAGHNTAQDIFIISVLLDIFYLYFIVVFIMTFIIGFSPVVTVAQVTGAGHHTGAGLSGRPVGDVGGTPGQGGGGGRGGVH